MSSVFIEGVGYIAIDKNKSEADKQATIKYMKEVAPKYETLGGFWSGFDDTKSMIYRWGQKLVSSEDEEKNRWYQEQIKQWGQMVGVYDSIALAKYYEDITANRELTSSEQADLDANTTAMTEFQNDMFDAYDNREGDISDVQKKYGYEQEELSVLEGLQEFGKMFANDPSYALGSIAGMVVKDPELLLLHYLRIPSIAGQASARAVQLAQQAVRMQPKYVEKVGKFMQNSRIQAGIGRNVEGATYGGVYEALHDLTFNGYIKKENVERGIALGALLGTAFGGISGNVGKSSWLVSKTGSETVAKKMQQAKDSVKNKPIKQPIDVSVEALNKNYPKNRVVTPEEVLLPEGLSHKARADLWYTRGVQILADDFLKKNPKAGDYDAAVKNTNKTQQNHAQMVLKESKLLTKQKKNGEAVYTKDEIEGLAAKNVAKKLEKEYKINFVAEGTKSTKSTKWGTNREKNRGLQDIEKGVVTRSADDFAYRFDDSIKPPAEATAKQILRAGGVGGVAGYFIASEDKDYGAILGMSAAIATRMFVKGVDVNQAKIRMKFYDVADKSKSMQRMLELYTGKTMATIKSTLKGDNPKMTHESFLNFVENHSTTNKQFGKKARKALPEEQQNAINAVRELMNTYKTLAKDYGVLKSEQFIDDYIAHIFKNKPPTGTVLGSVKRSIGEALVDTTNNARVRKLNDTISNIAKKYPNLDIETDVFKILDGYSRGMSKAIAGSFLVKNLGKVGVLEGKNPMGIIINAGEKTRITAKEMGYKTVDQPALEGKLIHPLIKNSLEDYFRTSVGSPLLLDKILAVNNALKRVAISFSFFHAQSLVLSALYAGAYVFSKSGKAKMKRVRALVDGQWETNKLKVNSSGEIIETTRNMLPNQLGDFTEASLLKELANNGVEIGVKANEFVDAGYSHVKKLYDKVPVVGKAQDWIDKWTWDIMHDKLKVFSYLTAKERALSGTNRGIGKILPTEKKPLTELEAQKIAGAFVNDAFGGQRHTKLALEWQKKALENANNPKGAIYQWIALATSPSKAKLSNLFLFSPDWTISNLRIAFRGMGMTKDIISKIAKGGKLTAQEVADWNMYAGYMTRALLSTSMLAYMANKLLADKDTDFDMQDFWLTGRLELGNGEEMVVSKQIAEPLHWLQHPLQTALNKGSTLPKSVAELFLGRKYITLKHENYIGPSMDRTNPKDLAGWVFGKTPISASPWRRMLTDDESFTEATKKGLFGAFGSPIYPSNN